MPGIAARFLTRTAHLYNTDRGAEERERKSSGDARRISQERGFPRSLDYTAAAAAASTCAYGDDAGDSHPKYA